MGHFITLAEDVIDFPLLKIMHHAPHVFQHVSIPPKPMTPIVKAINVLRILQTQTMSTPLRVEENAFFFFFIGMKRKIYFIIQI